MHELDRLECYEQVIDEDLKPGRAAERFTFTVRQLEQMVIRDRAKALVRLAWRLRYRPRNRRLKAPRAKRLL